MLKEKLLKEIVEDEKEYCFDKSYCSDETWKEIHGNETREEAYNNTINFWSNVSEKEFVTKIRKHFGDKYDYIINKFE